MPKLPFKTNKKEKGMTGIHKVAGISEKRFNEIAKVFIEEKSKTNEWSHVVKATMKKAKIKTAGDGLALGWMFYQLYQKHEAMQALEHLLFHRHKH